MTQYRQPGVQLIDLDMGFCNKISIKLFTREEYTNISWFEHNIHFWNIVGVCEKYNTVTIKRDTTNRHHVGAVISEEGFFTDYFDLLLESYDPFEFEYNQE